MSAPRTRFTRFLTSVNGDGRYGVGLLAALVVLLCSEIGGQSARTLLRYERTQISAGQLWRLVSAHVVHLNLRHAVLNALGAALMWALFARDYRPRQWGLIVVASVVAIDLGFWFLDPEIEWYVGASGALHGVMAAGTVAHLRRRDLDGWLMAAFLVVKLLWEQTHGALPLSGSADAVLVNAHLYGAVGGALCALAMRPHLESL